MWRAPNPLTLVQLEQSRRWGRGPVGSELWGLVLIVKGPPKDGLLGGGLVEPSAVLFIPSTCRASVRATVLIQLATMVTLSSIVYAIYLFLSYHVSSVCKTQGKVMGVYHRASCFHEPMCTCFSFFISALWNALRNVWHGLIALFFAL